MRLRGVARDASIPHACQLESWFVLSVQFSACAPAEDGLGTWTPPPTWGSPDGVLGARLQLGPIPAAVTTRAVKQQVKALLFPLSLYLSKKSSQQAAPVQGPLEPSRGCSQLDWKRLADQLYLQIKQAAKTDLRS